MTLSKNRNAGFSITELMISIGIGMLAMLFIMQIFLMTESQRRTTTDGSDAQINGVIGMFTIERELRAAGFGVPTTGCSVINGFNESRSPSTFSLNTSPVRIIQNTPSGTTNDRLELLYSGSDIGAVPAIIQADMPSSSSILRIDAGFGFKSGQLIAIAQGNKDCTLLQLTRDAQPTGTANITAPGSMWDLQHNPTSPYNPPGGQNIAPAGGYDVGALVFGFDKYVNHAYYIINNRLMMEDLSADVSVTNPVEVINGVIALRAVYGRDTNGDGIIDAWDNTNPASSKEVLAVRFGLVVRSGNYEKQIVTNSDSIRLWSDGPSVALRGEGESDVNNRDKHYRYKVYQTTIPLRNVIWGNAL